MATSYETIYNGFFKKKLVDDKKYFTYNGVTAEDILELVEEHTYNLMIQAIDEIYKYGKPQVDLYDKDEVLKQFNVDFIPQEYGLVQKIMYFKYYEEGRNMLNTYGLTFSSKELSVFSPANDRNSFLNMVKQLENDCEQDITNYLNRDRVTWKLKNVK